MDNKTKEFYDRLKAELERSTSWPSEYLYKFILPAKSNQSNELSRIFDNMGAVIKTKKSSTGKYVSYSINVQLNSPQHVVDKYLEVSKIEGIISL